MKKLMAALLAVAMVCAMAIPAFAAGGANTLTINGTTDGHTYEAYQVFTGTLSESTLSDVDWGNGVDGAGILADTDLPSSLKPANTAADLAANLTKATTTKDDIDAFAKVVGNHIKTENKHESTASGKTYTITGLPDGYYFVKDATVSMPEGATYSRYMLSIVKSLSINAKDTTVTLNKQIKHNESDTWGIVGDNQIGDTVYFRTITTVPNVKGYDTYTYEIHDTMSSELNSNVKTINDITIKVNDSTVLPKSYYTVSADGNTFTVSVKILDAVSDSMISVSDELFTYYSGVLNESAKMSTEGPQKNEAYLKYSNNPNDNSFGETVHKTVYDWTFQIDVTKVDGTDPTKKLEGAVFVLSKFANLDLKPDKNGNPAEHTNDLINLVKNSDGVYTVAAASTSTTYTMTTPTTGKISIKGLDDDTTYYLYETKAPSGYNSLTGPVTFKIATRTNENYTLSGEAINEQPTVTFNGTPTGSMAFDVANNAGTTLPGTGGIGTTIFYVIGGGLMVAAAILLITKKRMENR